jgi:hypothetical protein
MSHSLVSSRSSSLQNNTPKPSSSSKESTLACTSLWPSSTTATLVSQSLAPPLVPPVLCSGRLHMGSLSLVIAGVINGHVAAKYIYVRLFRGTDRMSKRTWSSFGMWALIVLVLWTIAWIIAEAIPVFNDLLGLISSLFASWFTYGLSGVFWLYMNRGKYFKNPRMSALTVLNFVIFLIGAVIVSFFL